MPHDFTNPTVKLLHTHDTRPEPRLGRPPPQQLRIPAAFYAQEKLDELRQLPEYGVVTLRVADSYAPEDAWRAHERLEAGGTRGRLVIDFTR